MTKKEINKIDNDIYQNQMGGETTIFTPFFNMLSYFNHHIMYLNNSKFLLVLL